MCRAVQSLTAALMVLLFCLAAGCEDKVNCPEPTLDLAVCSPGAGPFSLTIDNPYFPLPVGHHLVLEGEEGGDQLKVEITVLDETEDVAGVTCRVVVEDESENGETVEISHNFFAQAPDGTVCYFGEDVDVYKNGQVDSHPGAWRAGDGESLPGIMMPAQPLVGQVYYQEWAPGVARDMAEVVALDVELTTPAGTYSQAIEMRDCDPIGGSKDQKFYAPQIGLVVDSAARLTGAY